MTTDLKSGARDQVAPAARATPPGGFAPAPAITPPPPGNRAPTFPRGVASHTLALSGEGPGEPGGREVGNLNGVGGDAGDVELHIKLCCRYLERLRKRTQTELLEEMDAPSVALLVDVGFVDDGAPLTFSRSGWKWVKSYHRQAVLEMAYARRVRGAA